MHPLPHWSPGRLDQSDALSIHLLGFLRVILTLTTVAELTRESPTYTHIFNYCLKPFKNITHIPAKVYICIVQVISSVMYIQNQRNLRRWLCIYYTLDHSNQFICDKYLAVLRKILSKASSILLGIGMLTFDQPNNASAL